MSYSLKYATVWNMAGYLYLLIASFLTTPILIQYLGVSEFARYAIVMGIVALLSAFDLGLSRSTVYYLIRARSLKEKGQVYASSFVLYTVIALVFSLGALFLDLSLVAILIFGTFMLAQAMTLPESRGNFALVNLRNFIVGTANTLGAAYIAKLGGGVVGILELLAVSMLVTYIILTCFASLRGRPSKKVMYQLIRYGLSNQLGKVASQLESQYAKFLLVTNPFAVSVYTISSNLITKLVGGVAQMSAALFPHLTDNIHQPESKRLYHRLQLGLVCIGILAIVLYQFVGYSFITWWLGDNPLSYSVHHFLSIFRFYAALLLLTPITSTVVDAYGKPMVTSLFGTVNVALTIIVAVILYPSMGLLAPAYAGVISLGLLVPTFLVYTEKILSPGGNVPR